MDMEDEELHAYVGQKEEDLVQDMIHHFAPDYVGKDNFDERYMQYREEVLEPAAQDVSADKNADDMAGTDYDSEDFVDNRNMVGDDEINQEESVEEGTCNCSCGNEICESCGKSHTTEALADAMAELRTLAGL
jgi:hypothetical protein